MADTRPVLIVGAGPVGLTAAAYLVRAGVPVTVLEADPALNFELRGSTFHPPTLDMLDEVGAAEPLIGQGLVAPQLQYRSRRHGLTAQFDFGLLADVTRHPFRVQAEQYKLTRILLDGLKDQPLFDIRFATGVEAVEQDGSGVAAVLAEGGADRRVEGSWLIGADGARSAVRRSLGIAFEGFTWPERFLVISTPFDFRTLFPDLVSVNYVADSEEWFFMLQVPGLWRCMFPVPAETSDDEALSPAYVAARMDGISPAKRGYEIAHTTLYRVHQRVARTFRGGRAFLIGDAAHINNPLGGMGLNGGIHDAVNLTTRLARVWRGEAEADELDGFDRQRRGMTIEHIQKQSIRNKENLEARDEASQERFRDRLRDTAADPRRAYDYLLDVSMIRSLWRAAEIR